MTPKARKPRKPELRIVFDDEDLTELHDHARSAGLAASQFGRSIIKNFLNRARAQTNEKPRD